MMGFAACVIVDLVRASGLRELSQPLVAAPVILVAEKTSFARLGEQLVRDYALVVN